MKVYYLGDKNNSVITKFYVKTIGIIIGPRERDENCIIQDAYPFDIVVNSRQFRFKTEKDAQDSKDLILDLMKQNPFRRFKGWLKRRAK